MGFTTYGYRTESESAIDNEVPLYFSGANKQAVSRVAPGAAAGGTDVYADELLQEHSGGKIARFGFGTTLSPTWLLDITATAVYLKKFVDMGGTVVNIRGYGAPTDAAIDEGTGKWSGTDASAAIQAAVTVAKAAGTAAVVYCPMGVYVSDAEIDMANIPGGIGLIGDGWQNTRIVAGPNMAGKKVMDWTASGHMFLGQIGIGDTANASNPQCAIFMAERESPSSPGSSENASSEHELNRVKIDGSYTDAAWYNTGGSSSTVHHCIFSNSYQTAAVPAVLCTSRNVLGRSSAFATVFSGETAVSDWNVYGTEIHSNTPAAGTPMGYPILFDGNAGDFKFHGGILGGNANQLVRFTRNTGNDPKDLSFFGTTFYAQDPHPDVPTYLFYAATAGMTVKGLGVWGGSQRAVNIFGGAAACVYESPIYEGRPEASTVKLVNFAAGGTLNQPRMDARGLAADLTGGGVGHSIGGYIENVGTFTVSGTNTTRTTATSGAETIRGALTAAGGLSVTGAMAATGGVSGTTGSFSGAVSAASVAATGAVTAGTSMAATTTMTAGTGITSTTGNISASAGALRGRKLLALGTAIATGDWSISAGWGSTATVQSAGGNNMVGFVTIAPSGAGIAANPTITVTWKDSGYDTSNYWPFLSVVETSDGTLVNEPVKKHTSRTTTSMTWQVMFTPVTGNTYRFAWHVFGE